jgi:selenocysteine lyase/cysteine desulfurase
MDQRHLFSLDEGTTYLNAASLGPLPISVQRAGELGIADKARPWERRSAVAAQAAEDTRRLAADLINASPDDIAIVGSASNGVSVARNNIELERGTRVLVMEGEHSSMLLGFEKLALDRGAILDIVRQPSDHDWLSAIQERIDAKGEAPIGLAALTPVYWASGASIAIETIVPALRRQGASIFVDATQAAGVMPIDIEELQPDYLVFATYKWVLGPYGLALLYVAPFRQSGRPVEEHGFNRDMSGSAAGSSPVGLPYLAGARRFDRGERDTFITVRMALAGLELINEWSALNISQHVRMLTDRLGDGLEDLGLTIPPHDLRSPHIFGARIGQTNADRLVSAMEAERIHVSARQGWLRISPHIYNDENDIERIVDFLRHQTRQMPKASLSSQPKA